MDPISGLCHLSPQWLLLLLGLEPPGACEEVPKEDKLGKWGSSLYLRLFFQELNLLQFLPLFFAL